MDFTDERGVESGCDGRPLAGRRVSESDTFPRAFGFANLGFIA